MNTIDIIGKCVKRVFKCVSCSTEREASNIGIFFAELLKIIDKWQIESNWNNECANTPGFGKQCTVNDVKNSLDLDEFRRAIKNTHILIKDVMVNCMKSGEYMKSRNSLIVLHKLELVFPATKNVAEQLNQQGLQMLLQQGEEWEDLLLMGSRYKEKLEKMIQRLPNDNLYSGSRKSKKGTYGMDGKSSSKSSKSDRTQSKSDRSNSSRLEPGEKTSEKSSRKEDGSRDSRNHPKLSGSKKRYPDNDKDGNSSKRIKTDDR